MDLSSPYPAEVSLAEEGEEGFVFRLSGSDTRLYFYDADHGGRSFCNVKCELLWSPVIAPPSSKSLGEWKAIRRDDGHLQWSYRGRPIYFLRGDTPNDPKGDGEENGRWHLLPYEK